MEQKPIPTVAAGIKLICIGIALDLSDSFGLPVCSLQLVFTLRDYFCIFLYIFVPLALHHRMLFRAVGTRW